MHKTKIKLLKNIAKCQIHVVRHTVTIELYGGSLSSNLTWRETLINKGKHFKWIEIVLLQLTNGYYKLRQYKF